MKLIAMKPCSFGGRKFFIGDEIPAELLMDRALQQKMGVIAVLEEEEEIREIAARGATITVHTDEGDMALSVTNEGLQAVFDVLLGKSGEAESVIAAMEDADALILLHMADSRKSVKAAAESRAKSLKAAGDA